jgi:hypothetical protein
VKIPFGGINLLEKLSKELGQSCFELHLLKSLELADQNCHQESKKSLDDYQGYCKSISNLINILKPTNTDYSWQQKMGVL